MKREDYSAATYDGDEDIRVLAYAKERRSDMASIGRKRFEQFRFEMRKQESEDAFVALKTLSHMALIKMLDRIALRYGREVEAATARWEKTKAPPQDRSDEMLRINIRFASRRRLAEHDHRQRCLAGTRKKLQEWKNAENHFTIMSAYYAHGNK